MVAGKKQVDSDCGTDRKKSVTRYPVIYICLCLKAVRFGQYCQTMDSASPTVKM